MKTNSSFYFRNFILIIAISLFLFSCKKENEDLSKGFSDDIENFVPDSTIQALRDLGMIINEGKEPSMLEGAFLATPYIMLSTSVPDDSYVSGDRFADYKYYLKNQDNETLTLEVDTEGISSGNVFTRSEGNGAFISGYEEEFTVFVILESERYMSGGDTSFARTLEVISGTIAQDGIHNFQAAILMLDDYGDEFDHYIPINTGRLFEDGDSIAYRDGFGNMKKSSIINERLPLIWEHPE